MRPVFNDLLTEMQRSIGYFTSIDRSGQDRPTWWPWATR